MDIRTQWSCVTSFPHLPSPSPSPLAIRAGATIQHSGSAGLGELDSEILPLFVWQQILPHALRRALQSGQCQVEIRTRCRHRVTQYFLWQGGVPVSVGGPLEQRLHFQRRLTPAVGLAGDGVNATCCGRMAGQGPVSSPSD